VIRHFETAHLIYQSNTFLFPDTKTFFCLQRLLPSHYFSHSIQSIHLKWNDPSRGKHFLEGIPPHDLETWNRCWKEITEHMEGLKHVQVDIACGVYMYEEYFFTALVDIAPRVTMEVRVAWEAEEKGWPFTVRRGVEGLYSRCYTS
jgi:hypothetical protein